MEEENVRKSKRKIGAKSMKDSKKQAGKVPEKIKKLGRRPVREENEPCHVCGEKARSHNFGGMSCNCCKSFFRHFVLKNINDDLSTNHFKDDCKFKGTCKIDKVTRKKCKTCRFFKCVKIGMDPAWVLGDFAKLQKLKNAKLNAEQSEDSNEQEPIKSSNEQKLSEEDGRKIENISKYYKLACDAISYNFPSRGRNQVLSINKLRILLIGVISTAIRRLVYFARMIPEFEKLSLHDQTNLLRGSVMQLFMLRGTVTYDCVKKLVNSVDGNFPDKYPEVYLLSQLANVTQVSELHQGLPLNMSENQVDKMHQHLLQLQKKANTNPSLSRENLKLIKNKSIMHEEQRSRIQNECCNKPEVAISNLAKLQAINNSGCEGTIDACHNFIRSFVNLGEWGIKPDHFLQGPHVGIERAFMRRIPELLMNPWDSLVN
ncbi:Thyroid hormone receptor alpha-A [Folsomia candida]|uniref:Thyroid hormone receptor alpha-A n=1 Tax=Folsomia candida TaxID=158441 RepID=A0A226F5S2_FOLCA|nr:Thyroid hormone receptor alpha-A [Folsomia candida]